MKPSESRAVVQGFGSMGGATARYLALAGVSVVGIADREGVVYNPRGLEVETLLLTRDSHGVVDRTQLNADDQQLPSEQWLSCDAEILVPAAMSYVIDVDDVAKIRATIIVEAANVSTSVEAEDALRARGTTIIPDFLANTGTNQWWWWVCFGDIEPTALSAFTMLSSRMRPTVRTILANADRDGISPREAATRLSHSKRAELDLLYPRTVNAAELLE